MTEERFAVLARLDRQERALQLIAKLLCSDERLKLPPAEAIELKEFMSPALAPETKLNAKPLPVSPAYRDGEMCDACRSIHVGGIFYPTQPGESCSFHVTPSRLAKKQT